MATFALQTRLGGTEDRPPLGGGQPFVEPIAAQRPTRLGHQGRIVGENPLLEIGELRTGFQPQLLGQQLPVVLEHPHRLCLATGGEQGPHHQRPRTVAERLVRHQRLDVGERFDVEAAGESGLEIGLPRRDPQPFKPRHLGLHPSLAAELAVGRPRPQVESLVQRGPRRLQIPLDQVTTPESCEVGEAVRVDPVSRHIEQIAGPSGHDPLPDPGLHRIERVAEPGHDRSQGVAALPGPPVSPDGLDEAIGGNGVG